MAKTAKQTKPGSVPADPKPPINQQPLVPVRMAPAVPSAEQDDGFGDAANASALAQMETGEFSAGVMDKLLARHGFKVQYVGGSLPPLFPKHPKPLSARLIRYKAMEHLDKDAGGGSEFDLLVVDVIHPDTLKVICSAQQPLSKALEDFFGTPKNPFADDDGDPLLTTDGEKCKALAEERILQITFMGQLDPKENGRSGMKMFMIGALPAGAKVSE